MPDSGTRHQCAAVLVEEQHEHPRSVGSSDLAQPNRSAVDVEALYSPRKAGGLDALPKSVTESAPVDRREGLA